MKHAKKKPNLGNITQEWVSLIVPMAGDYSAKMTESELSRMTGIPQQSASRYLGKLATLNLINYERQGRNKVFYLDMKKQTTGLILAIVEAHKSLRFCVKNREISVIIGEIAKYCESLIVFGSYSSGSFSKDSDLDIVVLGKYNKQCIKKIKQKQTIEINEHYSGYNGFRKALELRNTLSVEIMKNHLLFGDISKIVNIFMVAAHDRR
ncbi:MAG: helix-turn-helix domain-containing protein [Candidatus Aenigmatarchaeota archaeon]